MAQMAGGAAGGAAAALTDSTAYDMLVKAFKGNAGLGVIGPLLRDNPGAALIPSHKEGCCFILQ